MKKIVVLVIIFVMGFTFAASADFCGLNEEGQPLCVSAGVHCCTNAGPADFNGSHQVFLGGQYWTCSEWMLYRYQSYNCAYCDFHWNEPEEGPNQPRIYYIDHAYMHDFDYSCTGLTYYAGDCGAMHIQH